MKTGLTLLASLLLISSIGLAAGTKTAAKTKKPQPSFNGAQLGTSFRFDGSSLHGKFQSAPSTVATVENDKYLDDLLGARRNFKDRLKNDSERN